MRQLYHTDDIRWTHFNILGPQVSPSDHVKHSARSTTDNLLSGLKLPNILTNAGPSDTSMARDVHVVTESEDNGLDLHGQFSGWGEDQGLGLPQVGVDGLKH